MEYLVEEELYLVLHLGEEELHLAFVHVQLVCSQVQLVSAQVQFVCDQGKVVSGAKLITNLKLKLEKEQIPKHNDKAKTTINFIKNKEPITNVAHNSPNILF